MKKTKEKEQGGGGLMKAAVKSAVLGILLTLLLILGVAALTMSGTISPDMSDEFIICSVLLGATLSGAHCAKLRGSGVITAGMTAAAVYLAIILLGTIFFAKNENEGSLTLKIVLATAAGGCFGGVLRLYRKTKKSKIRRKI